MAHRVIAILILSAQLSKDMFSVCSLVWRMTHSIDAHVTLTHRKIDGGHKRQAWLINTGHTHLSVRSGPWIIRTDYMQIATRMANNWKENNKMAKTVQGVEQKPSNQHKEI